MEQIPHSELVPMDIFLNDEPVIIDLVYAKADHPRNIFKEAIYHDKARFWCHKDLAAITLIAARILHEEYEYVFELKDSLRTYEAQEAMAETEIVKANPHWATGPHPLLSAPGMRGHPRAMAIDICLIDSNGVEVDMGTPFDYLSENPSNNPAARDYTDFSDEILSNRKTLENTMMTAAEKYKMALLPLPAEWWDFRFPNSYTEKFAPIKDADLPKQMQVCRLIENNLKGFDDQHFENLKKEILETIEGLHLP